MEELDILYINDTLQENIIVLLKFGAYFIGVLNDITVIMTII